MTSILKLIFTALLFPVAIFAQESAQIPPPPAIGEANFFTLAENGAARCVIVTPPGKGSVEMQRAVEWLRTYLRLVTGAEFEVGSRLPQEGRAAIHLGETEVGKKVALELPASPLPMPQAFRIHTPDAKTLVIRGATDAGTLCGVVALLRKHVGVHRVWPGEPGGLGDVVPRQSTLRLPRLDWRSWPRFTSRHLSNLASSGPPRDAAAALLRMDDWLMLGYTIPSNESYNRWLSIEQHGRTHPEYFPVLGGQRVVPEPGTMKSWQPCVSNPDVVRVMAQAVIAHLDANPGGVALNFAVNDGTGDCECAACRALDAPGADYGRRIGLTDRYIRFSNQVAALVAEKHPSTPLAFLSYGPMVRPPQREKLHANLIPVITMNAKANAFQRWDEWQAVGPRWMGSYSYHNDQHHFLLPKMDLQQTVRRIRYLAASGRAVAYYKEATPMWPLAAPLLHIESALLWEPEQDADALLRGHFDAFYGPASSAMQRFFAALESGYERWLGEEGLPHPAGKDIGSLLHTRSLEQFKVLNLDEMTRADAALDEAEKLATADDTLRQRIQVVKTIYRFAALGARQYWLLEKMRQQRPQSLPEALAMLATAREVVAAAREQAAVKAGPLSQPPVSHYATYSKTFGKPGNNSLYFAVEPDTLLPEIGIGLARAFENLGTVLRERAGAQRAGEWWRQQFAANTEPLLAPAFRLSILRSSGGELRQLVEDSSFETRAESRMNFALRSSAKARITLSTEQAHTGTRSVLFESCARASVSESTPAKPGQMFHISAWVRQGEESGTCQLEIEPRAGTKRLRPAIIPVTGPPDTWNEVAADFTAPPETTSLTVFVRILAQPDGECIHVDDLTIAAYPEL